MMELIDFFKAISLILPGDIDGLRVAPYYFRCLITLTGDGQKYGGKILAPQEWNSSGSEALGTDGDLGLKFSWLEQDRHWFIPLGL